VVSLNATAGDGLIARSFEDFPTNQLTFEILFSAE